LYKRQFFTKKVEKIFENRTIVCYICKTNFSKNTLKNKTIMMEKIKKTRRVKEFFAITDSGDRSVDVKINDWLDANEGKIEIIDIKLSSSYHQKRLVVTTVVLVDYYELSNI
jgi:hypothetical protein